ncbi:hypothetical protein PY254_11505 [Rhodanobacter sp. AS-Z3]|uniref:hypothetical protein n=1 Tax=Rhodanobacter sp. AS-Z3 TaxID=3031330 RepID=UPI00247B2878|nr:hypothetical protein [Rhodanobacter sp. AS-Z3]WEN13868.1 hypothetical protein PY254_11505 [Rhodanobacter sp. AS-Z3]
MSMSALSRLFRSKASVPVVAASDALPGDVLAAIGAARITIRAFGPHTNKDDDCRPIFEIPGLRSIKFDTAELGRIAGEAWPYLTACQLKLACDYANNLCVIEARRIGHASVVHEKPLKWFEKPQPRYWER